MHHHDPYVYVFICESNIYYLGCHSVSLRFQGKNITTIFQELQGPVVKWIK